MKKTLIRKSAFETNSSSQHSITLGGNKGLPFIVDGLYPDYTGIVHIPCDEEFGWLYERYNDAFTKAQYAAISAIKYNQFDIQLLTEVIQDVTGCAEVVYGGVGYEYGYIDHDSVDTVKEAGIHDYDTLKDFIFNKNSWLFTGNDNSDPTVSFYHVPVYGLDGEIWQPKRNQQISVEGCDNVVLLYEDYREEEIETAVREIMEKNQYESGTNWEVIHAEKAICLWNYIAVSAEVERRLEQKCREIRIDILDKESREEVNKLRDEIYKEIYEEKSFYKFLRFTITEI